MVPIQGGKNGVEVRRIEGRVYVADNDKNRGSVFVTKTNGKWLITKIDFDLWDAARNSERHR